MQKKKLVPAVALLAAITWAPMAMAQTGGKPTIAKLCGSCHEQQQGVMMGFLENISLKSKIIQMDIMSHKEVVKFTDQTTVKYVKDFADIRNYKKKGFQINFTEKNGEKIANEIIRFDILKTVTTDERLSKEEFKKLRQDPNVKVYDVRPGPKYKMAHIPGAGLMPAPMFDKFIGKLPADKNTPIIFYGVGGCLSPTASLKTKSLGYTDVKIYIGGYPDWVKTETGVTAPDWVKMAIAKDIPHVLIDLRDTGEVEKGHIKGAVGIEAAKLSANKAKFPANKMAPIIVYGPDADNAAKTVHSWGYKKVQVMPMPFAAWQTAGNPVQTGAAASQIAYKPKPKPGTISIADFKNAVQHPGKMVIVDVRNPDECTAGHVGGSMNIPADLITQRAKDIPADKEILLYCNTGVRAEMAHTALAQMGRNSRYLDAMVEFDHGAMEIEEK
ncbi:MAG: rhodanese-like domain-containing protein [Desulfobulbaceae bacterium]|nr:rhodanese-like domain-containing protein [Desulfobulbaceae bacterium]